MSENGINTNYLSDLMSRVTRGPWTTSLNDETGKWTIKSGMNANKSFVAKDMEAVVSNYDLRLMGMAWVLGMEVLRLRKKLLESK